MPMKLNFAFKTQQVNICTVYLWFNAVLRYLTHGSFSAILRYLKHGFLSAVLHYLTFKHFFQEKQKTPLLHIEKIPKYDVTMY